MYDSAHVIPAGAMVPRPGSQPFRPGRGTLTHAPVRSLFSPGNVCSYPLERHFQPRDALNGLTHPRSLGR
jgi:hypothetical protein